MIRMPFGKFKGVLVADLPDDYLMWLRSLGTLREPLRSAVEAEWRLRFGGSAPGKPLSPEIRTMADELVSAGYRKLAQLHHPDHGGDGSAMTLVNLASEALRRFLRS